MVVDSMFLSVNVSGGVLAIAIPAVSTNHDESMWIELVVSSVEAA